MDYIQPNPLSEKRANLLRAIQATAALQSTQQGGHDKEVSRLKDEFNLFMEDFILAPYGRRSDPCERLPPEVFVAILVYATFPGYWYLGYLYLERLFNLTLVSTSWQVTILSTPKLWTDLYIRPGKIQDMDMTLHIALHLSQTSPITLRIDTNVVWKEVESLIDPHRSRITEIHIDQLNTHALLDHIGYLPNLKSLIFTSSSIDEHNILIEAIIRFVNRHPFMERLRGLPLIPTFLDSLVYKKFTNIFTELDLSTVFQAVDEMPIVQHAFFGGRNLSRFGRCEAGDKPMHLTRSPLNWTSLTFLGKSFQPLLPLVAKTLVFLSLYICPCDFSALFRVLPTFVVLNKVKLSVEFGGDHQVGPIAITLSSCPAQILQLEFKAFNIHQEADDVLQWYHRFMIYAHSVFSPIRELEVDFFNFPLSLEMIDTVEFHNLGFLKISKGTTGSIKSLRFPSTLRALTIQANSVDWKDIHSDTVEILSLQWPFTSGSPERQASNFHLSHWPALCSLRMEADLFSVDWANGRLRNLRRINFGGIGMDDQGNDQWDHTTQFCRDLALHPEVIPSLETLSFSTRPPEMDILFILLERYNFRGYIGSSRIRRLDIIVSSDLIAPLEKICEGTFIDRPPNRELSWVGNIDMILDSSLSGCLQCYKVLIPCRNRDTQQHIHLGSLDQLGIELPSYPSNDQDVLNEWVYREEIWQKFKKIGRRWTCRDCPSFGFKIRIGSNFERDTVFPKFQTLEMIP